MNEAPSLETVLDVCGHKHRRIVLATLAIQQLPMSMNNLANAIVKHNHHVSPTDADDEAVKRIHVGLHQVHLPKLADTGFIQYDSERKVVEPTAQVGREDSRLSVILAMDPELPAAC